MRSPELSDMRVGPFRAVLDIIPQTANRRYRPAPALRSGAEVRSKAAEDAAIHHAEASVTQSGTVWVTGPGPRPGWVHTEAGGELRLQPPVKQKREVNKIKSLLLNKIRKENHLKGANDLDWEAALCIVKRWMEGAYKAGNGSSAHRPTQPGYGCAYLQCPSAAMRR